jgi:serine/threonine protein phosphatase PrpC
MSVPDRAVEYLFEGSLVLASDIGLRREENQDRVAVVQVHPSRPKMQPFLCIVVSDGMGGMVNGAQCATLTVAGLINSLISSSEPSGEKRLRDAAMDANAIVHAFSKGRGGATLSATLIEANGAAYYVNVGDSRIYGLRSSEKPLFRLTKDDTLEEAFGGHGRELVQYIGLGPAMMPHVGVLPLDAESILLTTDGAHFIREDLLQEIIVNAHDLKRITDRISALARWLGGRDNASIAAVQVPDCLEHLRKTTARTTTLWGVGSPLQIFYSAEMLLPTQRPNSDDQRDNSVMTSEPAEQDSRTTKQKRRSKKNSEEGEKAQLQISIKSGDETDDANR